MANPNKKRRSGDCAQFKPEWELAYFLAPEKSGARCLLCDFLTFSLKKYSLERHYIRKHITEFDNITCTREDKLNELKAEVALSRSTQDLDIVCPCLRASYKVSLKIAKSGKPFSAGELIKECMVEAAEVLCPSEVEQFQNVKLSHQTVARRVYKMGEDVKRQLTKRCNEFITYSLALDESTDISDTAQLSIFVRGVDVNLQVTEELLDVVPLKGTTTGADIFHAVEDVFEDMDLPWDRLFSVTTDGAPSMCGVRIGFVALMKKKMAELGLQLNISVHCVLHQENLCAKYANMGSILEDVTRIVNICRAHGPSHREFKELLESIHAEYSDIPYHCAVRWLSCGTVLKVFFALKDAIQLFLDMKGRSELSAQVSDPKWIAALAFLADITGHLNSLNLTIQGRDQIIVDMYDKVKAFQVKLDLWECQLNEGNLTHFECLQSVNDGACLSDYVKIIQNLKTEFLNRFKDFREMEPMFELFVKPFSISPKSVSHPLQLELIDLQCSMRQKDKFNTCDCLLDFYKTFPQQQFPKIHMQAAKVILMFGSSYVCESFFSLMNLIKSKHRASMSNESLRNSLRLMASHNFVPDIESIVSNKKTK